MSRISLKELSNFKTIWVLLLSTMMVTMTSCLDDDNGGPVVPAEPVAYVSLYQGLPTNTDLDIYVDDRRINFDEPFEFTDFTGYMSFYTGDRDIKFTPYNASNTLIDSTVTLKADSLYSIFVTGGEADDLDLLVVEDNIPDETEGKALIRIVNLSPDAPEVNITKEGEDSPIFEEIAYTGISEFKEIEAGNTTLELSTSAEGEALKTVDNYNFMEDRVYTLVVRGYTNPPSGNSNELSVQVIPYFYNLY